MASSFTTTVPAGTTVTVRIIDSTSRITKLPFKALMGPSMPGLDDMPALPTWSFLIEHASGRKLLFDLGIPVDWQDTAPVVANRLKTNGWDIQVEKPTTEILEAGGVKPEDVEAIVWSHWHWDHIGNPSYFPPSTKVIVGPGFKDELLPAYPTGPKSNVRESDFAGRTLQEITFKESNTLNIGPFEALDYFHDGSFYLLNTPGHATGHLAGLARTTTSPSTFIFMGGDLTHHSGELRPSPHLPLPESIPSSQLPSLCQALSYTSVCPGAIFEALQTFEGRSREPARTTPFFDPAMGKDIPTAIETIKKTMEADADENVLYIFAHDAKVREVVKGNFFPGTVNAWKEKGWRDALLWRFLEDFEEAARRVKQGEGKGGKL